jgi:hypothetical protein
MITAKSNGFKSVRWPVRALAWLIVAMFAVSIAVSIAGWGGIIAKHGVNILSPQFLLSLPAVALLLRTSWHAARFGRAPEENIAWPFASERVLFVYFVVLAAAHLH